MSRSGLVILVILSLVVVGFVIGKNGKGANNYIVRNTAAVYSLILSLLAIVKSNQGMLYGCISLYIRVFGPYSIQKKI